MLTIGLCISLREKCPNMGLFLILIYLHLDFSANTGKYGPEITLYLDTFHAVYGYTLIKGHRYRVYYPV